MTEKRACDEPEPAAKRAASSARLFESLADYRTLLEYCGQTLAAQLYCASEDHYATIDEWVRAQSADTIGRAILKMLPQYDTNRTIVATLLRTFPAVWTTPIDGEPFVWRLYSSERGNAGEFEPLIVELCTVDVANCADSDGNTLLYYATELMHASVVEHLLLKLRCNVPVNKHGHHALFAPLLHGSVEVEPMQRIIRAFHYARQCRPNVFRPFLTTKNLTVLGWLLKYPYPELVRTWLKRHAPVEFLTADMPAGNVKAGDVIGGGALTITPEMVALLSEHNPIDYPRIYKAYKDKDINFLKELVVDGAELSIGNICAGSNHAYKFTALAIDIGDSELLELSIVHNGDTEHSCWCGQAASLIHRTIARGMPSLFEILLKNGAVVDTETRSIEQSPICQMIGKAGFEKILLSLLPSIELNAVYTTKRMDSSICIHAPATLLSRAILLQNRALIVELLARGASIKVTDYSSLYYAVGVDSLDIVDLLLAHGAVPTVVDLILAAHRNNIAIFERLSPLVFNAADVFDRFAKSPPCVLTCKFCRHTPIPGVKEMPVLLKDS